MTSKRLFSQLNIKAKKALATVLAVSVMLGVCSCGNKLNLVNGHKRSRTEVVEFSWWGTDVRHEYMLEGVKDFKEKNPGISVSMKYSEWVGYDTLYNMNMLSEKEADVMLINYPWLSKYSEDGTGYYDLNKLGNVLDLSGYTEADLGFGTKGEALNAIPIAYNAETFYYNKTQLENYGLDIPKTWDDLYAAAKVMDGEAYPLGLGEKPLWFVLIAYEEQRSGKQIMDEDGNLMFDASNFQNMIEMYKDLVDNKVIDKVESFEKSKIESGEYAGYVCWLSDAENNSSEAVANGYEIIVGDYPILSDGSLSGWYIKPATMYAISANTVHPEAAGKLLNYLINDKDFSAMQGMEKGYPICRYAQEAIDTENMPLQLSAYEHMQADMAKLERQTPYIENSDIISEFVKGCQDYYFDKISSEEQSVKLCEFIKETVAEQQEQ